MNMKFKIESPEHSKRIQEELFKLGCKWRSGVDTIKNTDEPYLYVEHDRIACGYSGKAFIDIKSQEKTLADLIEMNKKDDGLISGDEAFMAWYNGDKIEVCYIPHNTWVSFNENTYGIPVFKSKDHKFRLKPKTVTINGTEYNRVTKIESDYSKHTIKIQLSSREDTEKLRKYIAETFLYK